MKRFPKFNATIEENEPVLSDFEVIRIYPNSPPAKSKKKKNPTTNEIEAPKKRNANDNKKVCESTISIFILLLIQKDN